MSMERVTGTALEPGEMATLALDVAPGPTAQLRYITTDLSDDRFRLRWNEYVVPRDISLQIGYLQLMVAIGIDERGFPVIGVDDRGITRSVAYFALSRLRIAGGLSLKTLLLGGGRATGLGLWFDPGSVTFKEITTGLIDHLRATTAFSLIVLKDFSVSDDADHLEVTASLGFINQVAMRRSHLVIEEGWTYEDYLLTLPSKKRVFLKQVARQSLEKSLDLRFDEDVAPLTDELYPLYQAVSANASESKTPPLPPAYFRLVGQFIPNVRLLTIRKSSRLIAFCLTFAYERSFKCLILGMDHAVAREHKLWYVIVNACVRFAMDNGMTLIDLGSTNYAMKRKFDPAKRDVAVSVRLRNRALNSMTAPLIRALIAKRYRPRSEISATHGERDSSGRSAL